MNPATADIVAAVEGAPASEVVILPNNKNVDPRGRAGRGGCGEAGDASCPRARSRPA